MMAWTKGQVFCLWKWTSVMAFIVLPLHLFVSEKVQIILPILVTVTQKSYQAEKNHNITLDFTFTPKVECSHNFWLVLCDRMEDDKVLYQFVEVDGDKVSETQDEQFSGRVQSDKDVLKKGQIRLHLSSLKMEDSGSYVCILNIGHCKGSDGCNLIVTDSHPSELPATTSPPSENRGRTGLPLAAAAVVTLIICYFAYRKKTNSERQPLFTRQTVFS